MSITLYKADKNKSSLDKEIFIKFKSKKLINDENVEEFCKSVFSTIQKYFNLKKSSYTNTTEFFGEIIQFYDAKFSGDKIGDFPYYLLSFFHLDIQSDQKDILSKVSKKLPSIEALHLAIENLLVMLPRDIAKNVSIKIKKKESCLYFLVNQNTNQFKGLIEYEKRYFKYLSESFLSGGLSFLTRANYLIPKQTSPYIQIIGNYNGEKGIQIIFIDLDREEKLLEIGFNKVSSISKFVFIDLLQNLSEDNLTSLNVCRLEFLALFILLYTFLYNQSELWSKENSFEEFKKKFIKYTQSILKIGTIQFNNKKIEIDDHNDPGIDLAKLMYHSGEAKENIIKKYGKSISSLLNKEISNNTENDDASKSIQPDIVWYVLSEEVIALFIEKIVIRNNQSTFSFQRLNNQSDLGYFHADKIYFPNLSKATVLQKIKTRLENFAHKTIYSTKDNGKLTKRLGHMFERHVENILNDSFINVIFHDNNDPDILGEYNGDFYVIECKSWKADIEYILGTDYIINFKRLKAKVDKAKKQAKGWSKNLNEIVSSKEIRSVFSVVLVPYPVYSDFYIDHEKCFILEETKTSIFTPEDFIKNLEVKYKSSC